MSKKLLTVIMPCYNMEKFLRKGLSSLVVSPEKMADMEILVVNDGSKDKTSEIAHEFATRYPDAFNVIDKQNGHYGSAVNAGLKQATGEFVKILDGDDWYEAEGLEQLLKFLSSATLEGVDAILTDTCGSDPNGIYTITPKLHFPERLAFSPMEMPYPRKRIYGHVILAFRTQILKDIGYRQTEGVAYTDMEWMTIPWAAVRKAAYCPSLVYVLQNGRDGQSMEIATYCRNYHVVADIVKGMMRDYAKYTARSNEEQKNIVFQKIMLLVDSAYNAGIFGYAGYKVNMDLRAFDREVRKYPNFYADTHCYANLLMWRFDILPIWRNHKIVFTALSILLRAQSFCRSICGKIKRAFLR